MPSADRRAGASGPSIPSVGRGARVSAYRRLPAIAGPAFAVSIGYVDPGNWATDVAASVYGYRLLWVVLAAGATALILQLCAARIAVATGSDLASLISRRMPRMAPLLGVASEFAVLATDLAEFAGVAVGLRLLFNISVGGAAVAGFAAVYMVFIISAGRARRLEMMLMASLWMIAAAMTWQLREVHIDFGSVAAGAVTPAIPDGAALLLALGIIGATVMPHNLYLHSGLISRRCAGLDDKGRQRQGRFLTAETVWALVVATLVNGMILIVAANAGGSGGSFGEIFARIRAHSGAVTSAIFGSALIVSGIASSVTATLSNDYVLAGFLRRRIPVLVRRGVVAVPAAGALVAGLNPISLMVSSQVALAMILPAVVIPMLVIGFHATPSRESILPGRWWALSALAGGVCVVLDFALLLTMIRS